MTMTTTTDIIGLEAAHLLQVYRRGPVVFERGMGCRLFDGDGRSYLDLTSGVGVASLGHAHPRLAAALASQATALIHTSNLFYHPLQGEVAARLAALSGLPRAFFCNSGTEAVEASLKFARRYWRARGHEARTGIIALEHAFHGRTFGSLSVTWDEHYRGPFGPLVPGVTFVPADDPEALRAAVTDSTAAIIVEPIQGEGGVRPLSPRMAGAIADACAATGTLLIADEIQCGLGRTGKPFHSATLGLTPDIIAVGKVLGGGVPVGAALFSEQVAGAAAFGDHGSTYGGNLLACRAALVFLDELVGNGLMAHVARMGIYVREQLSVLAGRHTVIRDVRGLGLIWGIELDRPALPVVDAARERGLLINRTSDTVIRLLPPYIITSREIDEGMALLDAALTATFPAPR
ncbi:MAG: acetylornithine/succinylornithine family transaminase [Acidobacteria bacterium]|nr:acetylornithine/succinylornithine family transaminase [Acidobacteriota bacterium]